MKREFTRLPDAKTTERFSELHGLLAEHERTLRAFREGKAEYEALKLERQRAHNEDGKTRVAAYRAGKSDPGSKNEAKIVRKMEEFEDRQGVLERAYVEVERDIGGLISQRRAEWLPRVEEMVREDDSELSSLLDQLRDVLDRRQAHAGLYEWISELPPSYSKKVYTDGSLSDDLAVNVLRGSVGNTLPSRDDVRGVA
jgi:vacuolar-type H+-ATPase subunit I/STV1